MEVRHDDRSCPNKEMGLFVVGLTMPNQPRADKRHPARRLHLEVRRRVVDSPYPRIMTLNVSMSFV